MKTWVRKSLKVGVLSAGIILSAGGTAQASDLHTVDNEGGLNGNQLDVPVRIPIDVCGNAIAIAGSDLAHCEIENVGGSRAGAADETNHWLTRDNVGLLNGNQLLANLNAPINACGNAVAVLGNARAICEIERAETTDRTNFWHTGGNTGLLNGNQVAAILNVPINICGNAIAVLGSATAHCEDEGGGGMRPRPVFPIHRPGPFGPGGNTHGPNDHGFGQGHPGWNGPGFGQGRPGWDDTGDCADRNGQGPLDQARCLNGDWDADDHNGHGHQGHGGLGHGHQGHGHQGHGGLGHGHQGHGGLGHGGLGLGHHGHGHGGLGWNVNDDQDDCGNGHGPLDSTHGHGDNGWDDVDDDHGNGHGPQDSGDWDDNGDDNDGDNGDDSYGKPSRDGSDRPARQDAAALPVVTSLTGLTNLTSPVPVAQHAVASQTIDGVVDAG